MPKLKQLCLYFAVVSTLGLAGCTTLDKDLSAIPGEEDPLEKFATQQKDDIAGATLPSSILTPQLLYRILAGDIAAQRGEGGKGVPQWIALAKETQDARAAKQATLVAISAKNFSAAEEAANLWVTLAPASRSARQLMIGVLLQNKKIPQIIPHVQILLQSKPTEAPAFFAQMHVLWGPQSNLNEVVNATEILTQNYLQLPEAKFALAYAKQVSGQHDEAMRLLNAALKQKPDLDVANNLRSAITTNPTLGTHTSLTLTYAEALIKAMAMMQEGDYPGAKAIYEKLLEADSHRDEAVFGYGLLAWQQGDLATATARLTKVEAGNPPYADEVRFYLGRIAEQGGNFTRAQQWYKRVQGALQDDARRSLVLCLAKDRQIPAALALLRRIPQSHAEEKIQAAQLHAQIYAVTKAYRQSIAILTQALKIFPASADLYYDRALGFENAGHTEQAEVDLRQALKLAPDNVMILNGLGFILTDRNKNLLEAKALLSKARELAPNNLYVEDSWGWLLYRQGKCAEAEKVLRRVFLVHKGPEVIAHLGEVLWGQKKRQEAQQILAFGIKLYPGNDILLKTLKRLGLRCGSLL